MKKVMLVLLSLIVIAGCSPKQSQVEEELNVLSPKGAPALSILDYASENKEQVTFVDGADLLQATFLNPNPEYQVVIAPTNLGVKLASMQKTDYKLAAIVTWGNLYFVSENQNALQEEGVLAAFGEGSVPGLLLESLRDQITPEIVYYNSVADVQAALLSGKADVALMAEPAASAVTRNPEYNLWLAGSVQQMMEETLGTAGYPQAGIFVYAPYYEENQEVVDDFLMSVQEDLENPDRSRKFDQIELLTPQELGVPSKEIALLAWEGMNIRYMDARESDASLRAFLNLFDIEFSDEIYLK